MTVKIKKSNQELSGRDLGKELIRHQMGEWFAQSRAKKERFMNKKPEPKTITQEEIDEHVKNFLKKGGEIKKLEPFDAIIEDEDEDTDEDDIHNVNYGIKKILSIKINEMRY